MARVWLHIGMMKTGTTAVQEWFAASEDALLARGLCYIRVKPNLPACGPLADALARDTEEGRAMLARIGERIVSTGADDVLISAELFSALPPAVAQKVVLALAGHDIRVLVWLRRQDRFAEAVFKQRVKWNGETTDELLERIGWSLDYERFLEGWLKGLPDAELRPQVYEETGQGGKPDSILAMLTAIDRTDLIPSDSVGFRRNVTPCAGLVTRYNSIPQEQAKALRRANRRLMREYGEAASGRGDLLTPEQAGAIRDRYAVSNRRVLERWFPGRPALFDDGPAASPAPGNLGDLLSRFDDLFRKERGGH